MAKEKRQKIQHDVELDFDDQGNLTVTGLDVDSKDGDKASAQKLMAIIKVKNEAPGIPDAIAERYADDLLNGRAIRKMNDEEKDIYGGALVTITNVMPAFREGVAHLRPYVDITARTAYVDEFSRVALSPWWFYSITGNERAGALLHESMHVLNNHFQRSRDGGYTDHQKANIAQDMEINTTIDRAPKVFLPDIVVYPQSPGYNLEKGLSFENYFSQLPESPEQEGKQGSQGNQGQPQEGSDQGNGSPQQSDGQQQGGGGGGQGQPQDGQNQSGAGSGSSQQKDQQGDGQGDQGNGDETIACDNPTEARRAAADAAGVERASQSEQTIIKSTTAARISEELARSRAAGTGHLDEFYQLAQARIYRPKADWRALLKRVASTDLDAISRGRSDYSRRRRDRRSAGSQFIMPGMVSYLPTVMLGIDISGSMGQDDMMKTAGEAEALLKALDRGSGFRVFPVDTEVGNIKTVDSVKKISLIGGGGTAMEVAFDYVAQLKKSEKPDFFVLATDGGTDWHALLQSATVARRKGINSAILVTSKYGWREYQETVARGAIVPKGVYVIDCSDEED